MEKNKKLEKIVRRKQKLSEKNQKENQSSKNSANPKGNGGKD